MINRIKFVLKHGFFTCKTFYLGKFSFSVPTIPADRDIEIDKAWRQACNVKTCKGIIWRKWRK